MNVKHFLRADPEKVTETVEFTSNISEDILNFIYGQHAWDSFMWINAFVVGAYILMSITFIGLSAAYFPNVYTNMMYISPFMNLSWSNIAVLSSLNPTGFCSQIPKDFDRNNHNVEIIPEAIASGLFNSQNNTMMVTYTKTDFWIRTDLMVAFVTIIATFMELSNAIVLRDGRSYLPRVVQYLQFSMSSSLITVIIAVNTGFKEVVILTSLFALTFAVNILYACTELLLNASAHIEQHKKKSEGTDRLNFSDYWCLVPHISSWLILHFALVPIWTQLSNTQTCSDSNLRPPSYILALVAIQGVFFYSTAIVQSLRIGFTIHANGEINNINIQTMSKEQIAKITGNSYLVRCISGNSDVQEQLASTSQDNTDTLKNITIKSKVAYLAKYSSPFDITNMVIGFLANTIIVWLVISESFFPWALKQSSA